MDFAQKSAIVNEVNGFVNGATEEMIRKMIDEQMITDDVSDFWQDGNNSLACMKNETVFC